MSTLHIHLFGRLCVSDGARTVNTLGPAKVDELFSYLLLHRKQPCLRERLAALLWDDCTTTQARGYLRRALWQLQAALSEQFGAAGETVLTVDNDWVQCTPGCDLFLDIGCLDEAYEQVEDRTGFSLADAEAAAVAAAAELYVGDLLEWSYQEWCLLARERYRLRYVLLLDKLVQYHDRAGHYERALSFAERMLHFDQGRERSHRQLMRLYWKAGNRAAALRQFRLCTEVLRDELNVDPSEATRALYERICSGAAFEEREVQAAESAYRPPPTPPAAGPSPDADAATCLVRLRATLHLVYAVEEQLRRTIDGLERADGPHRGIA